MFLKLLEDHSMNNKVIFTCSGNSLLETILSRGANYVYPASDCPCNERLKCVLNDLQASILNLIAKALNGALRDALGILEQMIASSNGKITPNGFKAAEEEIFYNC